MIGDELDAPYQRPPLTKNLWSSEDRNVAKNLTYKNWDGKEERYSIYLSIHPSIYLSPSNIFESRFISSFFFFFPSSSFQTINHRSISVYYEKSIEKRFPKAKILRDTEVEVSTCSPISTIHVIIFQELTYLSLSVVCLD